MISATYYTAKRGSKGRRRLRHLNDHAMHSAANKTLDPTHWMKFKSRWRTLLASGSAAIAALLFALPACAAILTADLQWDRSSTPGTTSIFYAHTAPLSATNLAAARWRIDAGTNARAHATLYEGRYWFAVTALSTNGLESLPALLAIESKTVFVAVTNAP